METVKKWNTLNRNIEQNYGNTNKYNFLPRQSQARKTSVGDWQTAKWCQKGTLFQDLQERKRSNIGGWRDNKRRAGLYPREGRGGEGGTQFKSRYLFIHLTPSGHACPLKHCTLELNLKESQELNCSCGKTCVTWGHEGLLPMTVKCRWVCGWIEKWRCEWFWKQWWLCEDLWSYAEHLGDLASTVGWLGKWWWESGWFRKQHLLFMLVSKDLQYSAPTHPITLNNIHFSSRVG